MEDGIEDEDSSVSEDESLADKEPDDEQNDDVAINMDSLKLADQNLIPMNCADEVAIDGLRHFSVSNDTKRVESVRPEKDFVRSGPSFNDEHNTSVAGEKNPLCEDARHLLEQVHLSKSN